MLPRARAPRRPSGGRGGEAGGPLRPGLQADVQLFAPIFGRPPELAKRSKSRKGAAAAAATGGGRGGGPPGPRSPPQALGRGAAGPGRSGRLRVPPAGTGRSRAAHCRAFWTLAREGGGRAGPGESRGPPIPDAAKVNHLACPFAGGPAEGGPRAGSSGRLLPRAPQVTPGGLPPRRPQVSREGRREVQGGTGVEGLGGRRRGGGADGTDAGPPAPRPPAPRPQLRIGAEGPGGGP